MYVQIKKPLSVFKRHDAISEKLPKQFKRYRICEIAIQYYIH